MKLAASEIAWQPEEGPQALDILRNCGFAGLEIAPPRVAGPTPYDHPEKAADFAASVRRTHNLGICSMQSIWFGQTGSMFGPESDELLAYTKKAVLFAEAAGCRNLVFGSPKNRVLPEGVLPAAAVPFFKEAGDFAASHGTVVALEANPTLYGTNFITHTADAFAMVNEVQSPGFLVNFDFGTTIANDEDIAKTVRGNVPFIHHVHISEPNLALIKQREGHKTLAGILQEEQYNGYVSIEMKAQSLENLREVAEYVAEVFG